MDFKYVVTEKAEKDFDTLDKKNGGDYFKEIGLFCNF